MNFAGTRAAQSRERAKPPKGFMSVGEAADRIGVTPEGVLAQIRFGHIESVRNETLNRVFVKAEGTKSVEAMIEKRSSPDFVRRGPIRSAATHLKAPEGWLAAPELSEMFGVPVVKMRRFLIRMSHLFKRVRVQTSYYYDPERVKEVYENIADVKADLMSRNPESVPASAGLMLSEGSITSAAFKLFKAGSSMVDAIIELKQTAEKVRKLHDEFSKLKQTLTLDASQLVALSTILNWDEYPPTAPGLVKAARSRFAEEFRIKDAQAQVAAGPDFPLTAEDQKAIDNAGKK